MSVLEELLEAEREGWQALCTAGGADYYERRLAPGALMTLSTGVMDRAEALAAMRSTPPWSRFEISEPRVVGLTPDSAVLVYHVSAQRGAAEEYSAMISSSYARQDGRWMLAHHQQTPAWTIPGARAKDDRAAECRAGDTSASNSPVGCETNG